MARKNQGRNRAKKRGQCIFCKTWGELHEEHAIPLWLTDHLKYPAPVFFSHWGTPSPDHGPIERPYRNSRMNVPVGPICYECNHDVLGILETRNSPLIKRMIDGEEHHLTGEQQRGLGTWGYKTALTFALSWPHRLFAASRYEAFRRDQEPPEDVQVFLARQGRNPPPLVHQQGLLIKPGVGPYPNGFCTTFAFGELVLTVCGHGDLGDEVFQFEVKPNLRGGLFQIWPLIHSPRIWPPPLRSFDGKTVLALAMGLGFERIGAHPDHAFMNLLMSEWMPPSGPPPRGH